MAEYTFDVEVAKIYGIDAAVILRHLKFWLEKNAANNKHIHDGEVWTYNSIEAWHQIFPFWTPRQIETRLNILAEKGMIAKGNYNKSKYDRTCWYTIKSPELRISPNCEMEKTELLNGSHQNVEPIPYKNTDKKPYINAQFEEFWKLYPRKVNKKAAQRIFNRLSDEKKKKAIAGIKDRFNGTDPQFILYPSTYLNGERWCDEIAAPKPVQSMMI